MQGGIPPPPPPNGEAWGDMDGGPAPIGDIGATVIGAGEALGPADPGHGAGAAGRGASLGQGNVWAAAWHIGSTAIAKTRERR